MAVRNESVRLTLNDDGFTTGVAKAAAISALLKAELDKIDGTNVKITASTKTTTAAFGGLGSSARSAASDVDTLGRSSSRTDSTINQLTGRLRLLRDVVTTIGPGLIPIGAVGVPAIAGLASIAGTAALGVGALVASLQGVGDAIKAVDAYQLNPTVANLEKAQNALEALGPDAVSFVQAWDQFEPTLTALRDAGASGFLPGLEDTLTNLTRLGPQVQGILEAVGRAGGQALDDATASLNTDRWTPFLEFLQREAPQGIIALSGILGDLTHAGAELWMTFDPSNDRFLAWVGDVADNFDRWASSDSGREDVQAFLDYAAENGPAVQELFVSLVNTAAQVVQAAAPLGGPVLTALTAVSDVIGSIADSDLGTPIFTAVAALSALNRTLRITSALQGSALGSGAIGQRLGGSIGQRTASVTGALTALTTVTSAQDRARLSSAKLAEAERQKTAAIRGGISTLGRGAAAAGGLALATSGLAEKTGLSNTASLALIGTMGGPWGAAIGGGVGLLMDMAAATDDVDEALDGLQRAIDSGSFLDVGNALASAESGLDAFNQKIEDGLGFSALANPGALLANTKNGIEGIFGDSDVEERTAEFERLQGQMLTSQQAAAALGESLGLTIGPLDGSARSAAELDGALSTAAPAMERLGITFSDLRNAQAAASGEGNLFQRTIGAALPPVNDLTEAIASEVDAMDSVPARTSAVISGLLGVDKAGVSAATSADALRDSLDALLGPELSVSAATDQWTTALRHLSDDLAKNKTLVGQSDAAIQNRAAIRDRVADLEDLLVAQANNGASSQRLATILRRQSNELIASGRAAGLSGKEVRDYLADLNLTPKRIQTIVDAVTEPANNKVAATKKQLLELARTNPKPRVTLEDQASGTISSINNSLNAIDRNVTIRITTLRTTTGRADIPLPGGAADGDTVPKGGPYVDRHPYLLAPGEEVISNRNGQADRNRPLLKAINAGRLADGGTAGGLAGFTTFARGGRNADDEIARESRKAASGLKALKAELDKASESLDRQRQKSEAYSSAITGNFQSDIFARSDDPFAAGAASDPLSVLRQDIRDARQFDKLRKRLSNNGLSGAALQEIDSLDEAKTIAGLSRRDQREYQRLFTQRIRTTRGIGDRAANAEFGDAIREVRNEVAGLRADIKREEKQNRNNADRNADRFGDKVNGAAKSGRRDAPP